MPLLEKVLRRPSYGYTVGNELYVPTLGEMFREFLTRVNVFSSRKNWLALFGWTATFILFVPFVAFFFSYFTWPLFIAGFVYSMIVLGTHGTVYYHRYSTHRAYEFKNSFSRFIVRNLVVKLIPEEIYVISHHVHHSISETPGDPYNVHGGWFYCFLADVIHQPIAQDLSEEEYRQTTRFISHTGVKINSYAQYLKWGSICHPLYTTLHFLLNWAFWYCIFYLIGGHPLAICLFGAAGFWGFGVRTFNYAGHGGGKDKRKEGVDFNRRDLSINQAWPGMITGEWHNNHHLYPNGVRAGFLPFQWDTAWWFIKFYSWMGGIRSYRDYKKDFLENHYYPYQLKQAKLSKLEETHVLGA